MKVSPSFLSQLQSYVDGNMDLKSFRDWQLELLLNRERCNKYDQEFLVTVDGIYAEFLAGVAEDSFKESLKSLLPSVVEVGPHQPVSYTFVLINGDVVPQSFPEYDEYEFANYWEGTPTQHTYRRRAVRA